MSKPPIPVYTRNISPVYDNSVSVPNKFYSPSQQYSGNNNSMIGAAIGAGVNLVNGVMQMFQNGKNRREQIKENERSRQFAIDMWNRNNAFNVDMWNKQNEYNTPLNQMKRYAEAGINPHLAYANGGSLNHSNAPVSASQASASTGQMPAGQAFQLDVNQLSQLMLMKAQKENIEADTDLKKADANKTGVEADIAKVDLSYRAKQAASQLNLTDQQIEESKSRVSKILSEIEKLAVDKDLTLKQIENIKANMVLISAQVSKVKEETATEKVKRSNIEADTLYKKEVTESEKVKRSNIEADTRHKNEMIKLLEVKNKYADEVEQQMLKKMKEDLKYLEMMKENIMIDRLTNVSSWFIDSYKKQSFYNLDFIPVAG